MLRLILVSIPLAFQAILYWPLRAALTVFGILVGIAAVVIVVALGDGAEIAVQQKLRDMGENILAIEAERVPASGSSEKVAPPRLTEGDGLAILRESPSVAAVSPLLLGSDTEVSFAGLRMTSPVTGVTRSFFDIRVWPLTSGEVWSEQAENTTSRVCLLGANVAAELFGSADPVGQRVRIGRHPFSVSGVLAKRSQGAFFGTQVDTVVLMPVTTKRAKLQPTSPGLVQRLLVKARSDSAIEAAKNDATQILRQRHNLRDEAPDDFRIRNDDAFRQAQENILSTLRTLLTSVAAISLLVGGIGIMNITLVSVTERTREIGLRMAIGATRWHILLEFLLESVLLSLIGGALGVALSVLGTSALSSALSLPIQPSVDALLIALVVSSGIGAVFGLVPAWRAASLDPITALGRQ